MASGVQKEGASLGASREERATPSEGRDPVRAIYHKRQIQEACILTRKHSSLVEGQTRPPTKVRNKQKKQRKQAELIWGKD